MEGQLMPVAPWHHFAALLGTKELVIAPAVLKLVFFELHAANSDQDVPQSSLA